MPRKIDEIVSDLSQRFPQYEFEKPRGGTKLTFISWYNVVNILDKYAPGWSGGVERMRMTDNRIVLTYRISIPTEEGVVSRSATGTEELNVKGYGDPSSNAESMAFRRAAAKFGVGLYLYDKSGSKGKAAPMDEPVNVPMDQPAQEEPWPEHEPAFKSDGRPSKTSSKTCAKCDKPITGNFDTCFDCSGMTKCPDCGTKWVKPPFKTCYECNQK